MLTGALALKEDQLQFITNREGDIPLENPGGLGLYYQDTRFLSRFELVINGSRPIFLSSTATKHYIATFQFINPAFRLPDGRRVKQQTVSIRRSRFVTGTGMYERIGMLNCNHFEVELEVILAIDADFTDIFSVRGFKSQKVAGQITVTFGGDDLLFEYQGRDDIRRATRVLFNHVPEAISSKEVRFTITLAPQQFDTIVVRVQPIIGENCTALSPNFDAQLEKLARSYSDWDESSTRISTNNELFDRELLRASRYDIRALVERTPHGIVVDAGVPWYSVPFGRDAIITALQTLVYNPDLAEGTLRFLASNQGQEIDNFREEEPGKIMHELRYGELARLKEVPHTPYYGTVDATPLFLMLFVEAMEWCDSDDLYRDVLPAALKALQWIDEFGDVDGDGFVEYIAHRSGGVLNQGWKDSANAVQYDDGRNAEQPIALVEVQGYVYGAKAGMARLLRRHGEGDLAAALETQASALKERFNREFWMEEEGCYALALDSGKAQVRSVTSNAGHCLWAGICDPDKAERVVTRLLAPDMFSGWGIRTLSKDSPNYNPMSYHNGSVWPHDTALIALGMRRVGRARDAVKLVVGLIEAGLKFSDARLPELFCGFERDQRFNSNPTAYIVSCSPQAWAAGCVFMLLQCLLDVRPGPHASSLQVSPFLPDIFRRVDLHNLRVGKWTVSLHAEGNGTDVQVDLQHAEGLSVQVVPA